MAAAEGDEERVFGPSLLRMNPAIYATNLEFLRGTISIHHEGHEEKQQTDLPLLKKQLRYLKSKGYLEFGFKYVGM